VGPRLRLVCDTAPVAGTAEVMVWGDDTVSSVTWWYPDGQTITRIGDMTVIDPGEGDAYVGRSDPVTALPLDDHRDLG
jgi:hypothetical protein